MRDGSLIEPLGVQEVYVDNFTNHRIINGNMMIDGYRFLEPASDENDIPKTVVIRIVMPAANADEAAQATQAALRATARKMRRAGGSH
jgi:hypothetical protein